MISTYNDGLVTPGEAQILIQPRIQPTAPLYPILYTHGAGARADALGTYGNAAQRTRLVAEAGLTGISADFGGTQTWGNDAAMAAMTAAYNWLQGKPGVKPGKVILCGGSMGGLNALVWAAANRDKVAAVSIYIPVLNPSQIHDQNVQGYATYIDQSYPPAWNTAARRATKDPLYMATQGKYAGLPIQLHYGKSDLICLPENVQPFATAVGASCELFSYTGGHEEATEKQIDRNAETAFILRHARGNV